MEYCETIVVGGGPAGSSCAWQLKRHGRDVLLLDKQPFPRLKLCAGWVPQKVMDLLAFSVEDYPYSILQLKTRLYFAPVPFALLGGWVAPWRSDYSIRRIEFDDWLLKRSQATVLIHTVNHIDHQGDHYVIDGQFKCKYLVGAGGTGCPVRRLVLGPQRHTATRISTIEKEFEYPQRKDTAHLFFRFHGLRGYAWYVPKAGGYVNLGLAGTSQYFSEAGIHIRKHFAWFLDDLVNRQLLDGKTRNALKPGGHGYYLSSKRGEIKQSNCFLIGDSAGLATRDLGEGIGPAIESGLMAADEILGGTTYTKSAIHPFSLNPPLQWLQYVWG